MSKPNDEQCKQFDSAVVGKSKREEKETGEKGGDYFFPALRTADVHERIVLR
jgi:hypothetical protein